MTITIDEKLFAHINNDPFLVGSVKLEGNQFINTIGYLNQYINESRFDDTTQAGINKLQIATNGLVHIERQLIALLDNPKKEECNSIAARIVEDVLALDSDNYILVPGGWLAPAGGHAIIYQFTKDKDGNILLHINNSGSGLQFHEKKSDVEKELYNPVLTYKIPNISKEDSKKKEIFSLILSQILELQIPGLHNRDVIEPMVLYQDLFQSFSHLKGEIIHSDEQKPEHWYTGGQLSGTCAQRSLHQMLKVRFDSLDNYRRFIYGFKMKSLNDYQAYLKVNSSHKEPYLSQLEKAIRHNLRLLVIKSKEKPDEFLFSEAQRTDDLKKFNTWLEDIRVTRHLNESKKGTPLKKTMTQTMGNDSIRLEKAATVSTSPIQHHKEDYSDPLTLQGGRTLLTELDTVIDRCNNLRKGLHEHRLLEQLETLIHQLPLPDALTSPLLPFYRWINDEEKTLQFYQKINQLQELYFSCCNRLIGTTHSTPGMYLTKMTFQTIIAHINHQHNIANQAQCFHEQFATGLIHGIYPGSNDNVYLANQNSTLDQRINRIKSLYQKAENAIPNSSDKSIRKYYNEILNQHKDLKNKLESLYCNKYSEDESMLHQFLRAEDERLTALFYFFEHKNELVEPAFIPLIKKFELQQELEKALVSHNARLIANNKRFNVTNFKLCMNDTNKLITQSNFLNNATELVLNDALKNAKYPVDQPLFKMAFERDTAKYSFQKRDKRTDNHTQLLPFNHALFDSKYGTLTEEENAEIAHRPITKETLAERELFHLRSHAEAQIDLSLNYFKRNIHYLKNTDYQMYLEANIFQPGLLMNKLKSADSDEFLSHFDAFITEGLTYYQKRGSLSQHSLYFIKLKYLVNQYAFQYAPEKYTLRMQSFHKDLNRLFLVNEDKTLQSSLHQLRFLSLYTYAQHYPLSQDELNESWYSYFYSSVKTNNLQKQDVDFRHKTECKKHNFLRFLSKNTGQIKTKQIGLLLKNLELPINEPFSIQGNYPVYHVSDPSSSAVYRVDLEKRSIFNQKGFSFCTLPLEIIHHPIMNELGLNKISTGFMSADGNTYCIEKPPIKVRIIIKQTVYYVQKEFTDLEGVRRYFQLTAQSEMHQKTYKLANEDSVQLEKKILNQREVLFWKNTNDERELLISNSANPHGYMYAKKEGARWLFNSLQEKGILKGILTDALPWENSRLTSFEDERFISTYKTRDKLTIEFERYQLSFSMNPTTKKIYYQWQGNTYELNDKPIFAEGVPSLHFDNGKKDICIIPIQRFINTKQRSKSEYYELALDTKHLIADDDMKNYPTPLWQYSDNQQYYVFSIKDGEPIPTSTEEALYLCYLYLGSNQPDKAWGILEYFDQNLAGLEGTFNELRYIYWIFKELPHKLKDDKENATISNPAFEACKLKALSLLTRYKQQVKHFTIPLLIDSPKNVNEEYQNYQIKQIDSFNNTINDTLYQHYCRYQQMLRDQDIKMTLSDEDKRSLLDYYHDNLPAPEDNRPKALGALGADWVSLRMNQLIKELALLNAKTTPNPYETARIKEIEGYIKLHPGVARSYSKLEYREINTEIPLQAFIKTALFTDKNRKLAYESIILSKLETTAAQEKEAMSILLPGVSENVFFEHFHSYLAIAFNKQSPFIEQLSSFCLAVLVSNRHIDLKKTDKNIPLLCNVLYRIIQSNKPGPIFNFSYTQLIDYARGLGHILIKVPQLVDNTDQLLKNSSELIEALPTHNAPQPVPTAPTLKEELEQIPLFDGQHYADFVKDSTAWRSVEELDKKLSEQQETTIISFLDSEERAAGQLRYQRLTTFKTLADTYFNETQLKKLSKAVTQQQEQWEIQKKLFQEKCIQLANQGPIDPSQLQQWQIELASGQRTPLTINLLLRLFFQNNVEVYRQQTGLGDDDIKQLHEQLARYINVKTKVQHLSRVNECINTLNRTESEDKQQYRLALGQLLYAKNLINPLVDPELAIFQLEANILIRSVQKEALHRLLEITDDEGFSETIERIIMGGGKSKVILPTLAYKKATGRNLTIIEVPSSLLRTNYVDLRKTSLKSFGQQAHIFEFNRQTDCSSTRLKNIHRDLADIMINKGYLVTTKDALQSLELKYLELMNTPPDQTGKEEKTQGAEYTEWKEQVLWADKLVNLFRKRGDLIIDEVHQGLLLKDKLNYTVGEASRLNPNTLKQCVLLYQFLHLISVNGTTTRFSALLDNNRLLLDEPYQNVFNQLAEELSHHEQSPLALIHTQLNAEEKNVLKDYLLGKGENIPLFFKSLSPKMLNQLALYKEQVSHLLPYTLKRNHNEHYGSSMSLKYAPEQRALAIPYLANNKPNERSRFGNYLETVNFTIQSLLIGGISKELLKSYIELLQLQSRCELIQQKLTSISETPSARQFFALFKNAKINLEEIDLDDEEILIKLHGLGAHRHELIYDVLEKKVLLNVQIDSAILHSDAINHVDIVRSCQGDSGTPTNHSTFHQRLKFNPSSTKGLDALVYTAFEKKTDQIIGFNFKDTKQAIATLFNKYPKDASLRAIIDINATFKGISNRAIANEIANYFSLPENKNKFQNTEQLKYILYFNEDTITALPLKDYPNVEPIVIGSSDAHVINERLGCIPEERFTLYDQDHTVGIDIKQGANAKALVMIDESTNLSHCFQGIMRMRSLIEGEQRVDLVVPEKIATKNIKQLCELMHQHESEQLKKDNYASACAKLENIMRNTVLKKILAISGDNAVENKRKMFVTFQKHFIETKTNDLYALYGPLAEVVTTEQLLVRKKNFLLADYKEFLEKNHEKLDENELSELENKHMNPIIHNACQPGVCSEQQMSYSTSTLGDRVEVEVGVQNEVSVEVQIEKEMDDQRFDTSLKEATYISWNNPESKLNIKELNHICPNSWKALFSTEIKASCNFYQSYQGQTNFLGMYLKPAHSLLFRKVNDKLECVLLSQQEHKELYNKPTELEQKGWWLTTTQNTVLCGKAPKNIKSNTEYQQLIEQVRFFNGELGTFSSSDIPLCWLLKNSKEKIAFFEQFIYGCHETLPIHLTQLKAMLFSNKDAYQFVISHLNKNKIENEWQEDYLEMDDAQKTDLINLSQRCFILANDWSKMNLDEPVWGNVGSVTAIGIGYLQNVLDKLLSLQSLANNIIKYKNEADAMKQLQETITAASKHYPDLLGAAMKATTIVDLTRSLSTVIANNNLAPASELTALLAENPSLTQNELDEYILEARNNELILLNLTKNTSDLITHAVYKTLLSYTQSADTLSALVERKSIPLESYLTLFNQGRALSLDDAQKIASKLLERDDCPKEFIQKLLDDKDLKLSEHNVYRLAISEHCSNYDGIAIKLAILEQRPFKHEWLNKEKLNKTQEKSIQKLLALYPQQSFQQFIIQHVEPLNTDLLQNLCTQAVDSKVIDSLLEKLKKTLTETNHQETALLNLLNNTHLTSAQLTNIAELPVSTKVIENILKHPLINHNDSAYQYLVKNKNLKPLLTSVFFKISEKLINYIINNDCNTDILQSLISREDVTPPQLNAFINRAEIPDELYAALFHKVRDKEIRDEIISRLLQRKDCPKIFIELLLKATKLKLSKADVYRLATSKHCTNYDFIAIKLTLLEPGKFITWENNDWLTEAKLKKTSPEAMRMLVDRYPEQGFQQSIIQYFEPLNTDLLQSLCTQAVDSKVIDSLLEKLKKTLTETNHQETALLNLLKNRELTSDQLTNIAEMPVSAKVIENILRHPLINQNASAYQHLVKNKNLKTLLQSVDFKIIQELINYIINNDCDTQILQSLIKRKELIPTQLNAFINRTKIPEELGADLFNKARTLKIMDEIASGLLKRDDCPKTFVQKLLDDKELKLSKDNLYRLATSEHCTNYDDIAIKLTLLEPRKFIAWEKNAWLTEAKLKKTSQKAILKLVDLYPEQNFQQFIIQHVVPLSSDLLQSLCTQAVDSNIIDSLLEKLKKALTKTNNQEAALLSLLKNTHLTYAQLKNIVVLPVSEKVIENILAFISRTKISEELYADLFNKVRDLKIMDKITSGLLQRKDCPKVFIELLLKDTEPKLSEDNLYRLATSEHCTNYDGITTKLARLKQRTFKTYVPAKFSLIP